MGPSPSRFICLVVLCVFFAVAPLLADHELTGTWSGTITFNDLCGDNMGVERPVTWNSPFTMHLIQSGTSYVGNALIHAAQFCEGGTAPFGLPVVGTISGTSFTILTPISAEGSGSASGDSMAFTIKDFDGRTFINASLTRSTPAPPIGTLSGAYEGGFSMSERCPNGSFSTSGTMKGSLLHTADVLGGVITVFEPEHVDRNDDGTCRIHASPSTFGVVFAAQVSGSNINGMLLVPTEGDVGSEEGEDEFIPFTGTISGNTISGAFTDPEGGSFQFTLTRTSSTPGPTIITFVANPQTISAGQSSTLTWVTINASSVSIDQGIGAQPASGSKTVSPAATTTYTLTATGAGGTTAIATETVTVGGSGGGPSVAVAKLPSGMLELTGAGAATDVFGLTNTGTGQTTVNMTANGSFFTVTPSTVTLPPGGSVDVSIRSTSPAPNSYSGNVSLSGNGVPAGLSIPVRLLVVAPPPGPVTAKPVESRAEVATPANQNPTGSVSFTNTGSNTLQGIAVSDVPWIVPQGGTITIAPGQSQQVSFTVDRSRRIDGSNLLGGAAGKITLRFFTGVSGKGNASADATTVASGVSVSVVDVVKSSVTTGGPSPLAAGEVAYFITGLSTRDGTFGDVLLTSGASNPTNDLRLFFTGTSGSPQNLFLPLAQNVPVAFPSVGKTIFGVTGQVGSLQLRGNSASNVSIAAVQATTSNRGDLVATALPVLRSDRAAGAGQRLILAGLGKNEALTSDIYVQEVSGNPATIQVEYFDADGRLLSSRPADTLAPFGFLHLTDVPLSGIFASARVSNTSTGGGRVAAYGVVKHQSGESWVVTDTTQQPGGSFVLPMTVQTPAGTTEVTRVAYVTNGSTSPVEIAVAGFSTTTARRRVANAAGNGSSTGPLKATLQAMQTEVILKSSFGYVTVTVPPGTASVNGRIVTVTNDRRIGTGTNAIPVTSGLTNGQTRRFAGVDEASAATVAAGTTGTYRSSVILIESAGQSATVRVTLRYSFAAGTATSALAVSSKDFALLPNQMLVIGDLARTIIGPQRDQLGDLRNMQVDVTVVGGSGRVIPLIQSVDNGSGDTVQRE